MSFLGICVQVIVSKSKANKELHGYLEIFDALATIAIKEHSLQQSVTDLVSIEALPYEWNGFPFVFYRLQDTSDPLTERSGFKTLAFWGNRVNVGIADSYEALPPAVADALATALMNGAPTRVQRMLPSLEDNFQQPEVVLNEGRFLSSTLN